MNLTQDFDQKRWPITGLVWGVLMYLLNVIVLPLIMDTEISAVSLLVGIPIWTLGGLAFGYTLYRYFKWKHSKT